MATLLIVGTVLTYLTIALLGRVRSTYLLFVWPVLIYGVGPIAFYYVFSNASDYASPRTPDHCLYAIGAMLAITACGHKLTANRVREALSGEVAYLKQYLGPVIKPAFWVFGLSAVACQVLILKLSGGGIASGEYAHRAIGETLPLGLWTLGGTLFEAFSLVSIIYGVTHEKWSKADAALLMSVLALRAIGGIRLVVIKTIVAIFLLRFVQGRYSMQRLAIGGGAIFTVGSIIGSLRGSTDTLGVGAAFFPIIAESTFNLLAYFQTREALDAIGYPDFIASVLSFGKLAIYCLIYLVPTGLYEAFGGQVDFDGWSKIRVGAEPFSPFSEISTQIAASIAPIGGTNLLATLSAMCSPWLVPLIPVLAVLCSRKMSALCRHRLPFVLILANTSLNFWRDPIEIAVKAYIMSTVIVVLIYVACNLQQQAAAASRIGATPAR